jgi:hypothetical protein
MLPKWLEFLKFAKMIEVEHLVHSTSLAEWNGAGVAFESGHLPWKAEIVVSFLAAHHRQI